MSRWNWIEDLVLPAAVAGFTAAWVWLWAAWAVRAVPRLPGVVEVSPWLLAGLLLGGGALTRLALASRQPLAGARLLVVGTGLAAMVAGAWLTYRPAGPLALLRLLAEWDMFISPAFVGLVLMGFMWWLGIRLGRAMVPQEFLERSFYGGVGALAAIFAANQLRRLILPGEALAALLVFFGCGLGALALVSFENARRFQESQTGSNLNLSRYWLTTVAAFIGFILVVGVVAAGLFSPEAFARLGAATERAIGGVTIVMLVGVALVVYVVLRLTEPLLTALSRLVGPITLPLPELPQPEEMAKRGAEAINQSPWLLAARDLTVLLLALAAVGLVLWWAVRRFYRPPRRDVDEQRESIATRELVWGQLRGLLRRRPAPAGPALPFVALSGAGDDPRLMVRRAYQAMLEWALVFSQPRLAGQTPAAYGESLAHTWPEARRALGVLTGAYERARYSPDGPTLAEARSAEGALAELHSLARAVGHPRTGKDALT